MAWRVFSSVMCNIAKYWRTLIFQHCFVKHKIIVCCLWCSRRLKPKRRIKYSNKVSKTLPFFKISFFNLELSDEKKNLKMIFHRCNMLSQHVTSMRNHFQIFLFVALELNTEQDGCRLAFTLKKCYCFKDNSKLKKLILKNGKVLETLLLYFIRLFGFSLL